MTQSNMEMGVVFLTRIAVGLLGNSTLLCLYSYTLLTGQKVRLTDPILHHLVLANNLVILSTGIPQTMAGFGWKNFLDDSGCKVILYLSRVARGVSLNTTCLLSGFQVTKLCTKNSWWKTSTRFHKYFGVCGCLFWILQLLVNVYVPLRVIGPRDKQNITLHMHYRYCSTHPPQLLKTLLLLVLFSSIDVVCLVFMIWASGSMVLVLHRHKERVRHIHSHIPSRRPDHETRATRTILTLVSMFVSFYCLSAIFTLCVGLNRKPELWMMDSAVFLSSGFSVLSPFVLISNDTRVTQVFYFCTKKSFL
ncbi:vomeronasal type-1 receptor 1-like [Perognathus longimembris pacificus]|uniref:vomeronasal type-1 receptor 1-like n=1 Tax=Perognathus longimembris pacificus TaxID=214514 RepID=UPI00201914CB|nr:vomeronasal type-1 receptor 1-like [Perognathus longimembris pacificus]XP_048224971.1 vomeronasal type-1 receptor 1-like [Perognathus longimembris pacificus]